MSSFESGVLNSKESAIKFIKEKIAKAKKTFSELDAQVTYYKQIDPKANHSQIPTDVFANGGSDLMDARVEAGQGLYESQQKDHFTSPEILNELEQIEQYVKGLEEDLVEIENGNEQTISIYIEESQKK
jgi:hypothetical protein